jgi:tRNA-splicing ligase RtcB
MKVFNSGTRLPIKSWCMAPEEGALKQASNLANLPFTFKWIALAPDTHQGYGMPIGGICAMENVVSPNCVGVDIGCGMCFVETNITEYSPEVIKNLLKEIRYEVPVGFSRHIKPKSQDKLPPNRINSFCEKFFEESLYYFGSLGGGNHFLEIQKNEIGNLCVMIHSGSRNLGKQVADHHNKIAQILNAKYFSGVPPEHDLAFLPIDSNEGQEYLADMQYCIDFALGNRMEMLNCCQQAIYKVFKPFQKVEFKDTINIARNYARMENHFGKNVMIHRKGATSAKLGEIGIIPGSQGTSSYIVCGKGNPDSFQSCSHGAGRALSRKAAREKLSLKDEIATLDKLGVIHSVRTVDDLDESASAYKNIDTVMAEQVDLVDIVMKLSPVAVIKG